MLSQRGKPLLVHDGHSFGIQYIRKDKKYWWVSNFLKRISHFWHSSRVIFNVWPFYFVFNAYRQCNLSRKFNCKARVTTTDTGEIIVTNNEHCHTEIRQHLKKDYKNKLMLTALSQFNHHLNSSLPLNANGSPESGSNNNNNNSNNNNNENAQARPLSPQISPNGSLNLKKDLY